MHRVVGVVGGFAFVIGDPADARSRLRGIPVILISVFRSPSGTDQPAFGQPAERIVTIPYIRSTAAPHLVYGIRHFSELRLTVLKVGQHTVVHRIDGDISQAVGSVFVSVSDVGGSLVERAALSTRRTVPCVPTASLCQHTEPSPVSPCLCVLKLRAENASSFAHSNK